MTESTEHDRYAIVDNGGEYSDHVVYYVKVPAGVTCAEALDVLKAYIGDAEDEPHVVACFASEPIAPWGAGDFYTVAELIGVRDVYYDGLEKCPERLRRILGFPAEMRVWVGLDTHGWPKWTTHPCGSDAVICAHKTQEEAVAYAAEKGWAVVTPEEDKP
jgi:hypothetical protein